VPNPLRGDFEQALKLPVILRHGMNIPGRLDIDLLYSGTHRWLLYPVNMGYIGFMVVFRTSAAFEQLALFFNA
jgi:hypothetical protein